MKKAKASKAYLKSIKEDYKITRALSIDRELIPVLDKLNALPFLCTVQSCWGHRDKGGYLMLYTTHPPEKFLKYLSKHLSQRYMVIELHLYHDVLCYYIKFPLTFGPVLKQFDIFYEYIKKLK